MVIRRGYLSMIENLPVLGSAYGLAKTSMRVYNASSPNKFTIYGKTFFKSIDIIYKMINNMFTS